MDTLQIQRVAVTTEQNEVGVILSRSPLRSIRRTL